MDPDFVFQLVNCLLLCWLGTEWMISNRMPVLGRRGWGAVGLWALLNFAVFLASFEAVAVMEDGAASAFHRTSTTAASLLTKPLTVPLAALDYALNASMGAPGLLSLLITSLIAVLLAGREIRGSSSSLWDLLRRKPIVFGFLGTWAALWLVLYLLGAGEWAEATLLVRVIVVAAAYYALCFWDVRRGKPELTHEDFLTHFVVAGAKAVVLLPLATISVAAAFLLLVTALEALRLPTAWLNGPIYYCALYGPFCSVYYFAKRQVASARLLPL